MSHSSCRSEFLMPQGSSAKFKAFVKSSFARKWFRQQSSSWSSSGEAVDVLNQCLDAIMDLDES